MTLVAEIWNSHVMSLIYANANPLQPGSSLPSKMKSTRFCDLLRLKLEILKIFKYNSHHPSPDVRCTGPWSPPGVALMHQGWEVLIW